MMCTIDMADCLSSSCAQIACIFEFAGALVLGRVSTSTIAGGIANISYFSGEPEIYGMFQAAQRVFLQLQIRALIQG